MKNHFFTSYAGNKRQEVKRIYEEIKDKLDDVDTIIEPYCGSCALSVYISQLHPKRFKYILNDNNHLIIELLNISKDENKFNNFIENLKELHERIGKSKEEYDGEKKIEDVLHWVYYNKVYKIRPYLYHMNESRANFETMKTVAILDFIRNEEVTLLNEDAINIYNQYKNDANNFIFLDPPYLSVNNDFYLNASINIYEYLFNNSIKNENALIVLCLNNIWIIKLLFKDCLSTTYEKKYETTHKKVEHIIIVNK